jgi:hypothetical protein
MNCKGRAAICNTGINTMSRLLILLFLLPITSITFAQDVTVDENLTFGAIFPGVPKTISKYIPGEAAEFLITGTPDAEIAIDFTLPSYMHTTGDNMQMIFSTTDCAFDTTATPDQAHPQEDNINPRNTIVYRLGSNGITIWLGGSVVPTLNQKSGDYTAIIVLTVSYTGN